MGVFSSALENEKDISVSFLADLGAPASDVSAEVEAEKKLRDSYRRLMQDGGNIGSIYDRVIAGVQDAIDEGRVAAVDGTNAIEPINFSSHSRVAVATTWVTTKQKLNPQISLTYTNAKFLEGTGISTDVGSLQQLAREMDAAMADDRSWPTTYREYKERQLAMSIPADIVLIDGPIVTQNLYTQTEGRLLLAEMLSDDKTYIGFVKSITASARHIVWAAQALNRGEYFVIGDSKSLLKDRYPSINANKWADEYCKLVRVVYRLKDRPFCIECLPENLDEALSIAVLDNSVRPDHEIPELLHQADIVCQQFKSSSAMRQRAINQMIVQDRSLGLSQSDERDYR